VVRKLVGFQKEEKKSSGYKAEKNKITKIEERMDWGNRKKYEMRG
jgi:hypothetical protein